MAVNDRSDTFPSFFKLILEYDDLLKLRIPIKFMTDYGNDLLDVVSLKVPTFETWEVKLVKENGRAWFGDGWPEFVEHYSIYHHYFLIFRYGGNSQFEVYIFDGTACEIDYPPDLEQTRELQRKVCESKTTVNSNSPSSSTTEKGMVALVREYISNYGTLSSEQMIKINSYYGFENPSFAVILYPTYVKNCRYTRLSVPSKFSAKYFINKQGSGICTLQTATGDEWLVEWVGKIRNRTKLSWGWKEFVLDNKLQVGDICVFELIKTSKHLFKVEIIRCSSGVDVGDLGVAGPSTSTGSPES